MTIYAEYLFIENALVGWLLLYLTGRLCRLRPFPWRVLAGSCLCGLSAFILFLPYQPLWLLTLFRLGFPSVLVLLVFGFGNLRKWIRRLVIFYLLSLAAGGIAIGAMYFTGTQGVTAGGFFYIGKVTWLQVILGGFAAWLGLGAFVRVLREKLQQQRTTASLCIVAGERSICATGFVDTGNFLRDPLTGQPVILAEKRIFRELWPEEIPQTRFRLIPFRTVEGKAGFLEGALPDGIFLQSDPPRKLKKGVVVALCNEVLASGSRIGDCSLILHPDIWEGESDHHE